MKKVNYIITFLVAVFFTFCKINCQTNFIKNPSFEDYDTCVNDYYLGIGNIRHAEYWNKSNIGTADWFNICLFDTVGVPKNFFGHQYPYDSNSYSGIANINAIGYREGIQGVIDPPLESGKYYCFQVYVSVADNFFYGVNELGVYFSLDTIIETNNDNDNLSYQLKLDCTQVLDTMNWHLLTGGYWAIGGEKHIVISYPPNLLWTLMIPNPTTDWVTYYYIDNVSLTECTYPNYIIPGGFSPNGDGVNDVFEIQNLESYPNNTLTIINRWGDVVYHAEPYQNDFNGKANKGMRIGGGTVTDGTYFYVFTPETGADPVKGSLEIRTK